MPTGLNLTLAAGDREDEGGKYGCMKLGWNGDLVSFRGRAVSVDYYDASDFVVSESSSSSWRLQAVQSFDDWGLEACAGYRVFSYDDETGADCEDLAAMLVGARWRF